MEALQLLRGAADLLLIGAGLVLACRAHQTHDSNERLELLVIATFLVALAK